MQNVIISSNLVGVYDATAKFAGHGHYKISITLERVEPGWDNNGDRKEFHATTNDMPAYDAAMDLEGDDKYVALYEIIQYKIADEVAEWLEG